MVDGLKRKSSVPVTVICAGGSAAPAAGAAAGAQADATKSTIGAARRRRWWRMCGALRAIGGCSRWPELAVGLGCYYTLRPQPDGVRTPILCVAIVGV